MRSISILALMGLAVGCSDGGVESTLDSMSDPVENTAVVMLSDDLGDGSEQGDVPGGVEAVYQYDATASTGTDLTFANPAAPGLGLVRFQFENTDQAGVFVTNGQTIDFSWITPSTIAFRVLTTCDLEITVPRTATPGSVFTAQTGCLMTVGGNEITVFVKFNISFPDASP